MIRAAALAVLLAAPGGDPGAVVVAPPDGPGGAPAGWIGAAVAETLPRALQRAGVPAVPGADRRRAQEALGVPAASVTRATAVRVAEALGAGRLVVGTWDQGGAELTLSLRLLDVRRGSLSAPVVFTGPLAALGRGIHSLAWDVALAGPRPPSGTRDALLRAADGVPFEALRALGEALAGRDASSRVAGLRRALAVHPAYDEAALALARLLADAGRFDEARQTLARVPASSPFAREARFLEGAALLGGGRFLEADVLYAALASERPTAAALGNRGLARLRQGAAASGASELLYQAVEAEPASVDLPFNLGWALLVEGRAEAAAFWLRGAVRSPDLSRRFERVLPSEAGLLLDPGRAADAEAAREHVARGEERLASGDAEGAVSEAARAALLDPYAARAHLLLGRAHRARGEDEKAIAALRTALWCRDDPALRREVADLLRASGRADEARRLLEAP